MENENLNLDFSNSVGNQPTTEEINYITNYLCKQLSSFESFNLSDGKLPELLSAVSKARSIENAISDLLTPDGGNYHGLIEKLNTRVNLKERLSYFLNKGLALLDDKDYQFLNKRNISDRPIHDPKYGYCQFDLDEYLIRLEDISSIKKVPSSFSSNVSWSQFTEVTNILLDYLAYIINLNNPNIIGKENYKTHNQNFKNENSYEKLSFVFLLRDTLMLYLGARRLQSSGIAIDAKAAMINRSLIQSFAPDLPNNPIYARIYNQIYYTLTEFRGNYSPDFVKFYKQSIQQEVSEPESKLFRFINRYLFRLCGQENEFLAVDCAAHGTMPLLAITASDIVKEFKMYTSVPWLHEFYGNVIYRTDFPHMRMLESLVCQEELFRFSRISGDRIIVEETCDPIIQEHAKFEMSYFLNLVEERFF